MIRYARPSDYVHGAVAAAAGPALLYTMEKFAPSYAGRGGFAQAMRVTGAIGLAGGFLYFYQRSIRTLTPSPIPYPLGSEQERLSLLRSPLLSSGTE